MTFGLPALAVARQRCDPLLASGLPVCLFLGKIVSLRWSIMSHRFDKAWRLCYQCHQILDFANWVIWRIFLSCISQTCRNLYVSSTAKSKLQYRKPHARTGLVRPSLSSGKRLYMYSALLRLALWSGFHPFLQPRASALQYRYPQSAIFHSNLSEHVANHRLDQTCLPKQTEAIDCRKSNVHAYFLWVSLQSRSTETKRKQK